MNHGFDKSKLVTTTAGIIPVTWLALKLAPYCEVFIAQYNYQKLQSEMENIASPKWRKLQRIF